MGEATVPVDHGEDDQSELTDEPHNEMEVASTSPELVAVLNRVQLATAGVYNGSHREWGHNSVKRKKIVCYNTVYNCLHGAECLMKS
jgi:hypothetical protein